MAYPHEQYFSQDYFSARKKFLKAASQQNLQIKSFLHPESVKSDRDFAIDVAIAGDLNASRLMVINSGTHGLEGLAGSGIQTGIIDQLENYNISDIALCFIHALNPWGMVHARRQNEDNIDLNRNFIDFAATSPGNLYYDLLHDKVCIPNLFIDGTENPTVPKRITRFIDAHGLQAYHVALFQGQYTHANGIGFGGWKPSWSRRMFYKILEDFQRTAELVTAIDIHTGLGEYGEDIIINNSPQNSTALHLAQQIYREKLVSISEEGALPYKTKGDTFYAFEQAFPNALNIPVALEFGTSSVEDLMRLQIEDNWLIHHGDLRSATGRRIKDELKDFFYPNDPKWRQNIFSKAKQHIDATISFIKDFGSRSSI
ncbi:DUF2817 domain-containing protein [Kordiimonas sp. SCSIO 12603]|uniref:DUF2817 domain-containing protein n=1 Tax=Kordiimonas sp. SCSIO 12603 TaxID=2829596 RepID=UPI002104F504|nr:DUF2817 domain-containing protein [Kordiimonas sp. SCSIO 12603]UTW58809.1 DUF2817 domain-containing protein [Kordiimonas sp. SCSIO 12603]